MKNELYWKKRQEQNYLAGEMSINKYYKKLEISFEQAREEIQSVINDYYIRYTDGNRVSYAEAQKLLSKTEIVGLKSFIKKTNDNMGHYNLELENMSIKARITRYQALEKQIDATLQKLYAIEYKLKGEDALKEVYSDSYYRTWYNIDVYKGFHQEFSQIDPRTIDALIKYPFNGADFSTRLWKQKDHMLQQLSESLTTMLIQGKNPNTLSTEFAKTLNPNAFGTKEFKTKKFEAYRLLHTEGSFIIEQGTLAGYKEDGVEEYQILATLDSKTSKICRFQDGEVYKIKDYVTGVNAPPFHHFCRTTTTPYYDDIDYSKDTRVARDIEGKSYKVPADIKYKEWLNTYAEI